MRMFIVLLAKFLLLIIFSNFDQYFDIISAVNHVKMECITVNYLKAIISSFDHGIPIEKIEDEYETWAHEPIPYLRLGYNSLLEFLRNQPEIKIDKNSEGESVFILKELKNSESKDSYLIRTKKNYKSKKRHLPYKPRRPRRISNHYSEGSSGYGSSSFEDESQQSPKILIDPYKTTEAVHEPILNKTQLIGDDFFLQLAIKKIGATLWRKSENEALCCGLCISGQTIRACTERLENISCISNKVTVMLGSVDIYEGRTLEQMKDDFSKLLLVLEENFNLSKSAITIGTIPPLANVSFMTQFDKYSNYLCFNNWLRQLAYNQCDIIGNKSSHYKIIDFYREFINDASGIEYNYFQENARNVSGTRYSYVLFNKRGRSKAVNLIIEEKKLDDYDDFPPSAWSKNLQISFF